MDGIQHIGGILGAKLDLAKKRRIGYMPEDRGLYKDLKLEPTLVYLATLKGLENDSAQDSRAGNRSPCRLAVNDLSPPAA